MTSSRVGARTEELKTLVSTWKSAVGDAMRKEYEEQLQTGGGATPK